MNTDKVYSELKDYKTRERRAAKGAGLGVLAGGLAGVALHRKSLNTIPAWEKVLKLSAAGGTTGFIAGNAYHYHKRKESATDAAFNLREVGAGDMAAMMAAPTRIRKTLPKMTGATKAARLIKGSEILGGSNKAAGFKRALRLSDTDNTWNALLEARIKPVPKFDDILKRFTRLTRAQLKRVGDHGGLNVPEFRDKHQYAIIQDVLAGKHNDHPGLHKLHKAWRRVYGKHLEPVNPTNYVQALSQPNHLRAAGSGGAEGFGFGSASRGARGYAQYEPEYMRRVSKAHEYVSRAERHAQGARTREIGRHANIYAGAYFGGAAAAGGIVTRREQDRIIAAKKRKMTESNYGDHIPREVGFRMAAAAGLGGAALAGGLFSSALYIKRRREQIAAQMRAKKNASMREGWFEDLHDFEGNVDRSARDAKAATIKAIRAEDRFNLGSTIAPGAQRGASRGILNPTQAGKWRTIKARQKLRSTTNKIAAVGLGAYAFKKLYDRYKNKSTTQESDMNTEMAFYSLKEAKQAYVENPEHALWRKRALKGAKLGALGLGGFTAGVLGHAYHQGHLPGSTAAAATIGNAINGGALGLMGGTAYHLYKGPKESATEFTWRNLMEMATPQAPEVPQGKTGWQRIKRGMKIGAGLGAGLIGTGYARRIYGGIPLPHASLVAKDLAFGAGAGALMGGQAGAGIHALKHFNKPVESATDNAWHNLMETGYNKRKAASATRSAAAKAAAAAAGGPPGGPPGGGTMTGGGGKSRGPWGIGLGLAAAAGGAYYLHRRNKNKLAAAGAAKESEAPVEVPKKTGWQRIKRGMKIGAVAGTGLAAAGYSRAAYKGTHLAHLGGLGGIAKGVGTSAAGGAILGGHLGAGVHAAKRFNEPA